MIASGSVRGTPSGQVAGVDEDAGRARAGDEHVDRAGEGGELVERDRAGVVLCGQAEGVLGSPVGDDDRACTGACGGGHRQARHRSGADDQHVLAREVTDVLFRAGQRGGDDARGHAVDVGLRV